jgi:hypothetical protein
VAHHPQFWPRQSSQRRHDDQGRLAFAFVASSRRRTQRSPAALRWRGFEFSVQDLATFAGFADRPPSSWSTRFEASPASSLISLRRADSAQATLPQSAIHRCAASSMCEHKSRGAITETTRRSRQLCSNRPSGCGWLMRSIPLLRAGGGVCATTFRAAGIWVQRNQCRDPVPEVCPSRRALLAESPSPKVDMGAERSGLGYLSGPRAESWGKLGLAAERITWGE